MKRKHILSILIMIVLLALSVASADAILFGNIDGVWGMVDDPIVDPGGGNTYGAACLRYGDGPPNDVLSPNAFTVGSNIIVNENNPAVQNGSVNNWNQVRYGSGSGGGYEMNNCGTNADFGYQSGIAFNGVDAIPSPVDYGENQPFLMGKLCHINNPIIIVDYDDPEFRDNPFGAVTMNLSLSNVDCGSIGSLVDPDGNPINPPFNNLQYSFVVRLDEAPDEANPADCDYGADAAGHCADAVIPGQTTGALMHCKLDNSPVTLKYTVAVLGFTQIGENGDCSLENYDPANLKGIFISHEERTNCACLWGAIVDRVPSAVQLNAFEARGLEGKIAINWQTAFETDNIGFNVYRSSNLLFEDAVQLNAELIPSRVPPGSSFGANYELIDLSAEIYTTYYYWLEDVDVNGEATRHAPVSAEWVE